MVKNQTKPKGSAPGQYLGFALQPVRLFYHLLSCSPDASVALEFVDDVSVHKDDDALISEQCKSALSHNPVSNWSVDLWKTFDNWVTNCVDGHLDAEKTQFRLYVTPTKTGDFAKRLSDAISDDEISAVLSLVSTRRAKLSKIPDCDAHLKKLLEADPVVRTGIIRNFTLESSDDFSSCDIENLLDATVPEKTLSAACRYGIGEAKRLIERRIRNNEPPLISAREFRKRFQAFIAAHDTERFLHSLSDTPTDEIIHNTVSHAPCFICQLELVNADIETKSRAASDFLRVTNDRTQWAAEGEIFEESLAAYDDQLIRRHANLAGELAITHKHLVGENRGLLLYLRCCEAAPLSLQDRITPVHFMSGSLNSLAQDKKVGWHPEYKDLLKGDA